MALRRAVVLAALTQLVSPFRVGAPRACALQQCRARARVRAVASGGETVRAAAPSGTASQSPFADLLRDAAPYIAMHRDSAMVIHIPGEVIDRPAEFSAIMDDLALLNLLGVELVIVVGVRAQIDARLAQLGLPTRYVGATRITDEKTMRIVKEVAGYARSEVESCLARGLTRISWGSNGSPISAQASANAGAGLGAAGVVGASSNPSGLPLTPAQQAEAAAAAAGRAGRVGGTSRDAASRLSVVEDPAFGRMRRSVRAASPAGADGAAAGGGGGANGGGSGGGGGNGGGNGNGGKIRDISGPDATFAPRPLRGVEVVSSNNLFTARPIGVRGGVDFGYSGEVRKVNRETITELLRRNWVVLMTPLGYSASGEVYNCNSHELACETAAQIGASKLILYTPHTWSIRAAGMVATAVAEAAAVAAGGGKEAAAAAARSPALSAGHADAETAGALWSSLSRVQSMRMLEAQAVVERYRKWQRETAAEDLRRMRAQQQQLRSRAQVAQPADAAADAAAADAVAAAAVAASTTTVIDPSAFSRSKLAPLTDGARRELSVWTPDDGADGGEAQECAEGSCISIELPPAAGGASGANEQGVGGGGRQTRWRCDAATQAHFVLLCSWSVRALSKGVRRAHLIEPHGGQVLEELYTSAGTGMLIARDVYEGFREASAGDIPQIVELISPLEEQGILTRRGREVIEADVERGLFHVLERDGQVLACAILKVIPGKAPTPGPAVAAAAAGGAGAAPGAGTGADVVVDGVGDDSYVAAIAAAAAVAAAAEAKNSEWAEIGCLAVNPKFRKLGRGEAMLGYLQRKALQMGVRHLFCLSTHTMQWFVERGFKEVPLSTLPESRIQAYNWKRNSKCFAKALSSSRDLDAQELFWGA